MHKHTHTHMQSFSNKWWNFPPHNIIEAEHVSHRKQEQGDKVRRPCHVVFRAERFLPANLERPWVRPNGWMYGRSFADRRTWQLCPHFWCDWCKVIDHFSRKSDSEGGYPNNKTFLRSEFSPCLIFETVSWMEANFVWGGISLMLYTRIQIPVDHLRWLQQERGWKMLVSQCMLLSAVSSSLSGRESLHAEVWRDGFELQHLPKDTGGGHGRVKSGRLDKCFLKGIVYVYIQLRKTTILPLFKDFNLVTYQNAHSKVCLNNSSQSQHPTSYILVPFADITI